MKRGFGYVLIKRFSSCKGCEIEAARTYMDLKLFFEDKPRIIEDIYLIRKIRASMRAQNKPNVKVDKDKRDYPSIICRCCDINDVNKMDVQRSYSGRSRDKNNKFYQNNALLNQMQLLGGVGCNGDYNGCRNPVGQCAEQHAAQWLLREKPNCRLEQIVYSNSFRPRDNSFHEYCEKCKKILDIK